MKHEVIQSFTVQSLDERNLFTVKFLSGEGKIYSRNLNRLTRIIYCEIYHGDMLVGEGWSAKNPQDSHDIRRGLSIAFGHANGSPINTVSMLSFIVYPDNSKENREHLQKAFRVWLNETWPKRTYR